MSTFTHGDNRECPDVRSGRWKYCKGHEDYEFLDISAEKALGVEVQIRDDGRVLWVHVDGQTVLRICRIPQLHLNDARTSSIRG